MMQQLDIPGIVSVRDFKKTLSVEVVKRVHEKMAKAYFDPKQLGLPGVATYAHYKAMSKFNRIRSMDMDAGLEYINNQTKRKIDGNLVEDVNKASATRMHMFRAGKTTCVSCGLAGDHWHVERHQNDQVMPFSVNLYGWKGDREVMMTWDHILPRSRGGSNSIQNAQCMCSDCNGAKGNQLSLQEMVDIVSSADIVDMYKMEQIPTKMSVRRTIKDVIAEMNGTEEQDV